MDHAYANEILACLPRRFCFRETDRMPQMLRNRASEKRLRRARVEPRFHQLDL